MQIKNEPSHFIVDELYNLEQLKEEKGDNGNYSYFILKKINLNQQQAITYLGSILNISSKRIHYCGSKDKVAITTQLISIQKSNEEFAQICLEKIKESNDLELTYLGQFNQRLNLSDNLGNKFTITLSDISKDLIKKFQKKKSTFKVLNYFQTQRFGICENTHTIGLLLIQNNIKDALFEVLRSLPSKYIDEFAEYLDKIADIHINYDDLSIDELSDKFSELIDIVPQFLNSYKSCFKHLMHHPRDVSGAFRTIPKKIRTLYVHAFQSAIFNEILNKTNDNINNNIDDEEIFLVGCDYDEEDKYFEEHKIILKRLGLDFKDLELRHMPELKLYKTPKTIYSKVDNFSTTIINENTLKVSFELGKGAYATQVIAEISKENKIITFLN